MKTNSPAARPPNQSPAPPASPAGPAPTVTRALTVAEPWAWLLCADFVTAGRSVKSVENRTWATDLRGTVAIHASTSWREVVDVELMDDIYQLHPAIAERLARPAELSGIPDSYNMPFHQGCIIGTVDIFACLPFDADADNFEQVCRDAGYGEWYDSHEIPPAEWATGPLCFLADNPRQFQQPIPAAGALNFWYLDNPRNPGLPAAVAAALRRPFGDPVEYRAALHAAGKPAKMPNESTFAKPRKKKASKTA